jgi:hypothetical protein
MMIGGVDIIIPTEISPLQQIIAASGAVLRIWPGAVFSHVTADAEVFIYKNGIAKRAMDRLGVVPELADTMIHVLAREGESTVVVDDPESEPIKTFLSDIRRRLSGNGSTHLS